MSPLEVAIVLAALLLSLGNLCGVLLVLSSQRRAGNGHSTVGLVDRVSALVGESELRIREKLDAVVARLGTFEAQLRLDLDALHLRVEFLERRDRDRPT